MLKCQDELLAGQLNKLARSLARTDAHKARFWDFPSEDASLCEFGALPFVLLNFGCLKPQCGSLEETLAIAF